jgi:2-C-methyl-D-erythritol 4-phosphate cytidylyltransferase
MGTKYVGVILAGGFGSRFGQNIPKQFMKVAGKSIIEHTIDIFQESKVIDEIAVVVNGVFVSRIEDMALANSWSKVKKILAGGSERYHSSLAAINAYSGEKGVKLIFHDAVRPLMSTNILYEIKLALEEYDAVDVAVPATDTIIMSQDDKRVISEVLNRKRVFQGQTPQAFSLETIKKAYEAALLDPEFATTDDCGVVVKYLPETPVYIVSGERKNIKLTYIEDLYQMDKLFQLKSSEISGNSGLDELKDKVFVVFGGNSGIGLAVKNIAESFGARVYSFSRSENNTDISKIQNIKNAFEFVSEKEKNIDYVVLTAAVLRHEAFTSMSKEDIDEVVDINYKGMIYVSLCSYEYLKKSQGQLLHFTSSSYTLGRPFYSLYSSSKAALVNFVQALAQEWHSSGIRVNCINPERTKTSMRVKNFGIEDEKTLLKADDVARNALAILLGDYTGQVIDVRIATRP